MTKSPFVPHAVMPKVDGKHFRCECGCNVFTEYERYKYRCNSCYATYCGEPADDQIKKDLRDELLSGVKEKFSAFVASQKDIPPEFAQVINEKFWDLL
jgi:hypothetical protein